MTTRQDSPASTRRPSAGKSRRRADPPADSVADGVPAADARAPVERLFELTDDLLAVISLEGRFTLLNPAWEQALGWTREELMAHPMRDLINDEDREQTDALMVAGRHRSAHLVNFTTRFRHRDGSWRWLLWSARCDGHSWYAAAKDVTDRMWLERQALHDPLTKLPNRLLLMDRARQALTRLHRTDGIVALLFIDLDSFKAVNDSVGHGVGDNLLIAVSERLEETLRDSDSVARLGGDEFVILAEDVESEGEAISIAERVLRVLGEPFRVGTMEVSMPASIGVSVSRDPAVDPEDMLREADVAMYRAKAGGGHRLELFDETLRREVDARLEIESGLRHALPRHELSLAYQPLISLADHRTIGAEALVRWHPHGASEMPASSFMPLAEESMLITKIGEWVMQTACLQANAWRRVGVELPVWVNVSARELLEIDLPARVAAALEYCGLPGSSLCIEISEQTALRNTRRAAAVLGDLRELGVRTALDGLGAGPSSLHLLASLPVDVLKIDRSLIQEIERDERRRAMVVAIMAFAGASGMSTVAVGIETERQLELAREIGCTAAQGFLMGAPGLPQRLLLEHPRQVRSRGSWRTIVQRRRPTRASGQAT